MPLRLAQVVLFTFFVNLYYNSPSYGNRFCKSKINSANCRFPCNCFVGSCDQNGKCLRRAPCKRPYFGEACQTIDRALEAIEAPHFAIDFDDSTCNQNSSLDAITLIFDREIRFHFLEIVSKRFYAVTMSYQKFLIDLVFGNTSKTPCRNPELRELSETTVQFRCESPAFFTALTMSGPGVKHICSVFLSGGRNFAAFSQQVSTITDTGITSDRRSGWESDKTVDNEPNTCFSSRQNTWEIVLDINFLLRRIVIHNWTNSTYRDNLTPGILQNFTLSLVYDSASRQEYPMFLGYRSKYDLPFNSEPVRRVSIKTTSDHFGFCELELFGECPVGKAGLECSKDCYTEVCDWSDQRYLLSEETPSVYKRVCENCASTCDIHIGDCTHCKDGFMGPKCLELCKNCGGSGACDQVSGVCSGLCHNGFFGERCQEICFNCKECEQSTGECINFCFKGFYGLRCNLNCSNCRDGNCTQIEGECPDGCLAGFTGYKCDTECPLCGGDGSCNQKNELCLHGCPRGFRGETCAFNCGNCAGSGTCHYKTATCSEGCLPGWWNHDCSKKCGNCNNNLCTTDHGKCILGCLSGFKGPKCDINCKNCLDESCNEMGHCTSGCKTGYAGLDCETACKNCDVGNLTCNRKTFACLAGCETGFFGEDCYSTCGQCAIERSCDRQSGKCEHGCQAGYKGSHCKSSEDDSEESHQKTFLLYGLFGLMVLLIILYMMFCDACWKCCQDVLGDTDPRGSKLSDKSKVSDKSRASEDKSRVSDTSSSDVTGTSAGTVDLRPAVDLRAAVDRRHTIDLHNVESTVL